MRSLLIVFLLFPSLVAAQQRVSVRLYWQHPSDPRAKTIELPLEEYVAGVVAGEANTFHSMEGLKAMAVVARTYAIRFRGRHSAEGFDFCATTHCQDLRLDAVTARVRRAVEATQGELLWWEGQPVAAYYHRHCGGMTEDVREVWPQETAPYLRSRKDTYCVSRGRDEWSARIRPEELARALAAAGIRGASPPGRIKITERTPSGRVRRLQIGGVTMTAEQLHAAVGRTLGWRLLRSASYEVSFTGSMYLFHGHGSGHGVGLCQVGADRRGEAGRSYRQILAFYYPGTVIGLTASGFAWQRLGGERVELWTTRPGEDASILAMADRQIREAERRSKFSCSGRPRLRIYPTVATFRDATGEPGWVAASTVARTVRLQPLEVLRSAGGVDSLLLHEFLHLLIEGHARTPLPWWFLEGLVEYLTDPGTPPETPAPLPEHRIENPRSQRELRQAYAIAHARVYHLVAEHGRARVMGWLRSGLPRPVRDTFSGKTAPDRR